MVMMYQRNAGAALILAASLVFGIMLFLRMQPRPGSSSATDVIVDHLKQTPVSKYLPGSSPSSASSSSAGAAATPPAGIPTTVPVSTPTPPQLVKPDNVTISGMVFFGRRDRVRTMHCYVERNLVDNGGWLDEVRWFANTNNEEDLEYLDSIVARSDRYKKIKLDEPVGWPNYTHLWRGLSRGTMYVKLDDDLVWLADDAIPRMVTTKLARPDFLAVSANLVNAPPLSFLHYHLDALHPYLPEFSPDMLGYVSPEEEEKQKEEEKKKEEEEKEKKEGEGNEKEEQEEGEEDKKDKRQVNPPFEARDQDGSEDDSNPSGPGWWRPSHHPFWDGPSDFEWDVKRPPLTTNHRWLRLQDDKSMHTTPAAQLTYDFWGPTYESWSIAAQQHYSLLENIERDNLDVYRFHPPWNMRGERIRINCLAIMGDDVLDTDVDNWPSNRGDEDMIVLDLPKQLQRHILVEGGALAAHFSFAHQRDLTATDLLARYHAYAEESICKE